ncbi:radical SAM protein [Micromonospora carbonacea]|uniref:radical SAM protein n=1 Tax=Micromonospora carbonacea TaxID=47853 RepID=UPI00371CEE68
MIGTRLDNVDAPRLIRGDHGWWFIGNRTWTLLRPEHVDAEGVIRTDINEFLREQGAYRPRIPKSFSLTVLTNTDCNLGCGYCFQNTALDPSGGHRPLRIARQRLDDDTIERIMKFTAARMAAAELDKMTLLLFGGEPLLNPRGCLRLLTRATDFGLRSASTATNGVLLKEQLAVDLYAAGLRGAQITFDGSRNDHDQIRVTHAGSSTFDQILHNVERATARTELRWNFRVNVSHHNFDRIGDLFGQLDGHVDPSRSTIVFAWVGDAGFGYGNDLRRAADVADAFAEWSIAGIGAGYHIERPSMRTTCQICSVPGGRYGAVVNADGTLYSSWQSAGKKDLAVGAVDTGYLDVHQVAGRWVTCGYEYAQADPAVADTFADRVDARVLDHLYTTGRL